MNNKATHKHTFAKALIRKVGETTVARLSCGIQFTPTGINTSLLRFILILILIFLYFVYPTCFLKTLEGALQRATCEQLGFSANVQQRHHALEPVIYWLRKEKLKFIFFFVENNCKRTTYKSCAITRDAIALFRARYGSVAILCLSQHWTISTSVRL